MLTAVLFTMAKIRKQFIHQQTNALRRHNTHTHTHTHNFSEAQNKTQMYNCIKDNVCNEEKV